MPQMIKKSQSIAVLPNLTTGLKKLDDSKPTAAAEAPAAIQKPSAPAGGAPTMSLRQYQLLKMAQKKK